MQAHLLVLPFVSDIHFILGFVSRASFSLSDLLIWCKCFQAGIFMIFICRSCLSVSYRQVRVRRHSSFSFPTPLYIIAIYLSGSFRPVIILASKPQFWDSSRWQQSHLIVYQTIFWLVMMFLVFVGETFANDEKPCCCWTTSNSGDNRQMRCVRQPMGPCFIIRFWNFLCIPKKQNL